MAGAMLDLERAVAQPSSSPSCSGRVTFAGAPQALNAARDGASAHHVLRDAVAAHQPARELVVALGVVGAVALDEGATTSIAATSAPERGRSMSTRPRWSMCWWVTIDQLEVLDPVPGGVQLALELVQRLARVRPRVDQRQGLVLDQVAVDPADGERGGDPQAGCPQFGVRGQRLFSGSRPDQAQDLVPLRLHVLARDQRLEVEPQQRLGVRGPHVEVPVGVVDRDAVEPADLAVGMRPRRSPPSSPPGRRPRS